MEIYKHRVHYYETDKMGIVHHSNYVRWLEEARVYSMEKMGYSFKRLEAEKIYSPVLFYNVEIKHSTTFDDIVEIVTRVKAYNGVRLEMEYEIKLGDNIVATAITKHCFTNESGLPLRLSKAVPELDKKFRSELERD